MIEKNTEAVLDLKSCMDIQLGGRRSVLCIPGRFVATVDLYLCAKGRFAMWFAASIIVNTLLMAVFLLVMLALARIAYAAPD